MGFISYKYINPTKFVDIICNKYTRIYNWASIKGHKSDISLVGLCACACVRVRVCVYLFYDFFFFLIRYFRY